MAAVLSQFQMPLKLFKNLKYFPALKIGGFTVQGRFPKPFMFLACEKYQFESWIFFLQKYYFISLARCQKWQHRIGFTTAAFFFFIPCCLSFWNFSREDSMHRTPTSVGTLAGLRTTMPAEDERANKPKLTTATIC